MACTSTKDQKVLIIYCIHFNELHVCATKSVQQNWLVPIIRTGVAYYKLTYKVLIWTPLLSLLA